MEVSMWAKTLLHINYCTDIEGYNVHTQNAYTNSANNYTNTSMS